MLNRPVSRAPGFPYSPVHHDHRSIPNRGQAGFTVSGRRISVDLPAIYEVRHPFRVSIRGRTCRFRLVFAVRECVRITGRFIGRRVRTGVRAGRNGLARCCCAVCQCQSRADGVWRRADRDGCRRRLRAAEAGWPPGLVPGRPRGLGHEGRGRSRERTGYEGPGKAGGLFVWGRGSREIGRVDLSA